MWGRDWTAFFWTAFFRVGLFFFVAAGAFDGGFVVGIEVIGAGDDRGGVSEGDLDGLDEEEFLGAFLAELTEFFLGEFAFGKGEAGFFLHVAVVDGPHEHAAGGDFFLGALGGFFGGFGFGAGAFWLFLGPVIPQVAGFRRLGHSPHV